MFQSFSSSSLPSFSHFYFLGKRGERITSSWGPPPFFGLLVSLFSGGRAVGQESAKAKTINELLLLLEKRSKASSSVGCNHPQGGWWWWRLWKEKHLNCMRISQPTKTPKDVDAALVWLSSSSSSWRRGAMIRKFKGGHQKRREETSLFIHIAQWSIKVSCTTWRWWWWWWWQKERGKEEEGDECCAVKCGGKDAVSRSLTDWCAPLVVSGAGHKKTSLVHMAIKLLHCGHLTSRKEGEERVVTTVRLLTITTKGWIAFSGAIAVDSYF